MLYAVMVVEVSYIGHYLTYDVDFGKYSSLGEHLVLAVFHLIISRLVVSEEKYRTSPQNRPVTVTISARRLQLVNSSEGKHPLCCALEYFGKHAR